MSEEAKYDDPYMIALKEIVTNIIKNWYFFPLCFLFFFIIASYNLSKSPILYKASMQIVPREKAQVNIQSSSLLSNFGLTQKQTVSEFDIFLIKMSSYETALKLDQEHQLMKKIFANNWDEKEQAFVSSEPTFSIVNIIKKIIGMPISAKLDIFSLSDYLNKTIEINSEMGVTTVSVKDIDPKFALWLLTNVYETANKIYIEEQREETENSINSISNSFNNSNKLFMKDILINLLVNKQTDLMLINMSENPHSKVISKPSVEKIPSSPNVKLVLIIFSFISIVIAFSLIILKMAFNIHFKKEKNAQKK
ncbi:MAG: hypothetical protein AB7U85_07510 [Alphaproteobacteria bacterium]